MNNLLQGGKNLETGLNIFPKPNIIEMRNLHRDGIKKGHQRANLGLYYNSIVWTLITLRRLINNLNPGSNTVWVVTSQHGRDLQPPLSVGGAKVNSMWTEQGTDSPNYQVKTSDQNVLQCTEMRYILCTWFGEISSCSCLTVLPGPAWVLINKICKEFFMRKETGLHCVCSPPLRYMLGCVNSARGSPDVRFTQPSLCQLSHENTMIVQVHRIWV